MSMLLESIALIQTSPVFQLLRQRVTRMILMRVETVPILETECDVGLSGMDNCLGRLILMLVGLR
jgi:hypothetical protein